MGVLRRGLKTSRERQKNLWKPLDQAFPGLVQPWLCQSILPTSPGSSGGRRRSRVGPFEPPSNLAKALDTVRLVDFPKVISQVGGQGLRFEPREYGCRIHAMNNCSTQQDEILNSFTCEKWWLRVLPQTSSLELLNSWSAFLHIRPVGDIQQALSKGKIFFLSVGLGSYQWNVTSQNRQVANFSNQ